MREITSLDEMKLIQLDIMDKIHQFCEENYISYCLSHGSLIGAVRHKGFIPWDDDIDIFMKRDDYERFCKEFPLKQTQYGLEIVNSNTSTYYGRAMSKVFDIRTTLIEPNYIGDDNIGVNIDIWPLDGVPEESKRERHIRKIEFRQKLLYGRIVKVSACNGLPKKILHFLLLPLSSKYLVQQIIKLQKEYPYNSSEFVSCYVDPYKRVFRRDWFSERELVPFEDRKYYIPGNANDVLTTLYGDYMKLPPLEQQQPHHVVNVYWKE